MPPQEHALEVRVLSSQFELAARGRTSTRGRSILTAPLLASAADRFNFLRAYTKSLGYSPIAYVKVLRPEHFVWSLLVGDYSTSQPHRGD